MKPPYKAAFGLFTDWRPHTGQKPILKLKGVALVNMHLYAQLTDDSGTVGWMRIHGMDDIETGDFPESASLDLLLSPFTTFEKNELKAFETSVRGQITVGFSL